MVDNFESIMTSYFQDFKKSMKQRHRFPVSLVEKHFNDVLFLVDTDFTYVQALVPRVIWLRPLGYEINVDEASVAITTLLAEEVDNKATTFGNYDVLKSNITMDLKTTSVMRKKHKIFNNLKEKFGEGEEEDEEEEDNEDDEEEDVPTQPPLALTQGQVEDKGEEEVKIEEGAEGEEASEAPIATEKKKRKVKALVVSKPKKVVKPKPTIPATRTSTRANAKIDKEVEKSKETKGKKAIQVDESEKRQRRKYIAPAKLDEERTKSNDNSQFQVVNHNPSSNLDNLCENIKNNVDLSGFSHIEFYKLGKLDMDKEEELVYAMMATFKMTPIKDSNSLRKSLYDRVEQRWKYSLTTERNIRKNTLGRVMPDLDKPEMTKAIKKYVGRFAPNYRAFHILQNKIENVVQQSTQIWKEIYGLTTPKEIEQTSIETGDEKDE